MLSYHFVIIGSLLTTIGTFAYLKGTIKGDIKPNRVSFLLWAIAPLIAFMAQIKQGVGLESLMTFVAGLMALLIFISTFLHSKSAWKITRFDIYCGALSALGLISWYVTQVGNMAILFSILADGLAGIPTIVKAYKYPDTELAWPWIMTSIGVVLTLLTLDSLSFSNSGFIIYIFLINTLVYTLVQFRVGERLRRHS